MHINDIFGNLIEITDLQKAKEQVKGFVFMAESAINSPESPVKYIKEFKLKKSKDQFGQQTTISQDVKNGKTVSILDFWKHYEKELANLS